MLQDGGGEKKQKTLSVVWPRAIFPLLVGVFLLVCQLLRDDVSMAKSMERFFVVKGGEEQQKQSDSSAVLMDSSKFPSRETLYVLFNKAVEEQFIFNNWDVGCADMAHLSPYFRAILYRQVKPSTASMVIVDVGANNGQDVYSTMASFHGIKGMCGGYTRHFTYVAIEPSPPVFCELQDFLSEKGDSWEFPIVPLNVALSNETGYLKFKDPGNEGGKLIASSANSSTPLSSMTSENYQYMSQCQNGTEAGGVKEVPTYTMDLLVSSLEALGKIPPNSHIWTLKIDTEGYDTFVMMGAEQLLRANRITFILFELMDRPLLRELTHFMDDLSWDCFLTTPNVLVPVHADHWWYNHLSNYSHAIWANGLCGQRGSPALAMLWRMYHGDDATLVNAFETLTESTNVTSQDYGLVRKRQ